MVTPSTAHLLGVPLVDLLPLLTGLLVRAQVGGDEGAIQDQVGKPLISGLVQGLAQGGRLRGEDLDGLILVPVGGGLRDPEALAQPADVGPVPEPRQGEDRLLPTGQDGGAVPGADLTAVLGQQARHEQDQRQWDVKDDTIGQRAEPPGRYGSCGETSCTGGSAPSHGSPVMPACLPAPALTGVKSRMPGSPLLRKPHWVLSGCHCSTTTITRR